MTNRPVGAQVQTTKFVNAPKNGDGYKSFLAQWKTS